jgi:hypothetical protein
MKSALLSFALFTSLTLGIRAEGHLPTTHPLPAIAQYQLAIKLIPAAHRLEVNGELMLPASETRPSVQFRLSDVMHDFQVRVIEPKVCAGAVGLEKREAKDQTVTWRIQPVRPFPAGEPLRLQFSYAGGEEIRPVFYLGEEGSFAGGFNTVWYPQLEGNARCTGKLNFSVPAGYKVIATGKRHSLPEQEQKGDFAFEITQPSMLTFAAAKYIVEERHGAQGRTTAAYLLRPRTHIAAYLERCVQVIDALTEEFGANPYGDFAIIETPSAQASKAGFAGASFEGFIFSNAEFLDQDFNTAYYGHEISHQWWGVSINKKSGLRGRMMLDEAMAQYGSLRVVEMLEGSRAAERYRRTGYPGYIAAQNATGYFMVEAGGFDQPLSMLLSGDYTRILADGKGFIVFDMLSRLIGRETFRRILQSITREYAASEISWDEFLQTIEKGAGRDLQWFYKQWFERKGAPEWEVNWRQEGNTVRGTIIQPPLYFRATVEVLVEGDDQQTAMQSVELGSQRTEFAFPVKFQTRAVTVDPHYLVLHRTPELRALRPALGAQARASLERNKQHFDQAEKILREALGQTIDPDLYGARFTLLVSLGQVFLEQKRFDEAKTHLQMALASPSRRAEVLPRAYLSLAKAAKALNDEGTLKFAVNGAITAEAAIGGGGVTREARELLGQ